MSWFRNWRDSWSLALISSDSTAESADVASSPSSWEVAPIWKENRLLSGDSYAWKEDKVKMADGNKRVMGSANREKGCLPASGVFLLDWRQQEWGVAMKSSGLQCLAGQVIQIVHGWQAEGWLSEIYRMRSWASSEIVPVSMESPPWISWVMEEEVFSEDFLLLRIGVQGYLDCEAKIWSAFR